MGERALCTQWHAGHHAKLKGTLLTHGCGGLLQGNPMGVFYVRRTTLTARVRGGALQNFPARGKRSTESHWPRVGSTPRVRGIRVVSSTLSLPLEPCAHGYTQKLGKSFPRVARDIAEPLRMRASAFVEGQLEGHPSCCTWFFTLPGAAKVRGKHVGCGGEVHAAPRLGADAPRDSIVAPESGFARPGLSEYISANRMRGGRGT